MNPSQELVQRSLKAICDEVAAELNDLDFKEARHWDEAFDIAKRYIKYKVLQCVANGEWVDAGIPANTWYLKDLNVIVERKGEGVHMGVQMPTVMQILREQDDPNVN